MAVFISSLLFFVLAERGDKTRLLAIAFAAKYPWKTVMAAVAAASFILCGLWACGKPSSAEALPLTKYIAAITMVCMHSYHPMR